VEDYPFGAIKNFKENDVKLETYLRNAPWEMPLSIEID
jgi:hypothetical protein